MSLVSVNPATGEVAAEYPEHDAARVDATLGAAVRRQRDWAATPVDRRAAALAAVAGQLRAERSALAELITTEMGKPIVEAESEIEKCASTSEWFAENAVELLAPRVVATAARRSLVQFLPLGVVLAVMPWNYPVWQFFRAAIPALIAGNSVVLKPASNVAGCGQAIESLFIGAGVPTGVVSVLLIRSGHVAGVIRDSRIAGVTLTGSGGAGQQVASIAGESLKKCVLELGGSDPFIVLADADLAKAATAGCTSRFRNTGQACVAAKRFFVDRTVADEFTGLLAGAVEKLAVGDPMSRATQIGPMARRDLREEIDRQVTSSVEAGAVTVTGGSRIEGRGFYFEPTVLRGVTSGMPAFREETFGPLAAIVTVDGEDQAVAAANDSVYGLGASVWTRDLDRGAAIAARLEAGAVAVNGIVASDARLPFGGVKRSGFGRELAEYGVREFVNVQSVTVNG